jgi:uncharacterized glyoxalase superfamily protein PhnB
MPIHELFVTLRVKSAADAIAYYERVFAARENFRLVEPSGRIGHAELDFGGTTVMLSDEYPEYEVYGPDGKSRATASIHLHVDDCDALIARALEAGATLLRPASDAFYGERSGVVRDPFGHEWNIGHSIEDVTPEEMQRRYTELLGG